MRLFEHIIRGILRGKYAGRKVDVRNDDTFIVSYPKSGNTWTRFLLGNLISPRGASFKNIEEIIPDIYQHNAEILEKIQSPRVLKSHEYFDPRYRKVIHIIRDPRAVAVSYWYHQIKFREVDKTCSLEDFVDWFVLKGNEYGTWSSHTEGWLNARQNNRNILLVRYEDLISNPEKELEKIARHMDLNISDALIKNAIMNSSFDRMRSLEKEQSKDWKPLQKTRKEMSFVRKGRSDSWKDELTPAAIKKIELHFGKAMAKAGYQNDGKSKP